MRRNAPGDDVVAAARRIVHRATVPNKRPWSGDGDIGAEGDPAPGLRLGVRAELDLDDKTGCAIDCDEAELANGSSLREVVPGELEQLDKLRRPDHRAGNDGRPHRSVRFALHTPDRAEYVAAGAEQLRARARDERRGNEIPQFS